MRGLAALLLLGGCGIEQLFVNAGHEQFERPASKIVGAAPESIALEQITVIDGQGNELTPFMKTDTGAGYEMRLPSSRYSMLRVRAISGNMEVRAIVPGVVEESEIAGVDLDARNMTETLITEARLSADGSGLDRVTPEAYLGTRMLIRAGFDAPGPTQDLLHMVERLMTLHDPLATVFETYFFREPVLDDMFVTQTSALEQSFLTRNPFDYVGDGTPRNSSADFDAKLAEVAQLYRPAGCPHPDKIRVVFTADFREGAVDANGNTINRFKWATDKPGKSMFFVGWIYDGSPGLDPSDIQDPAAAMLMGNSTPNVVQMYDDGTNGDQTAGDNVWSIFFDLPRSTPPDSVMRIGYKYTWGTSGAPWTGSEEWPGNSRILEVVDDNGDDFVFRRDVFGDEASNKDKGNFGPVGTIDWDTLDRHGCGFVTHENADWDPVAMMCQPLPTPDWLGPLTVTCTQ